MLKIPARLWLFPLLMMGLTALSIAEGRERKPASMEKPVYASEELRNPVAATPAWTRSLSQQRRNERREKLAVPGVAVSIDRTGQALEGAPDSVRRVYFRR